MSAVWYNPFSWNWGNLWGTSGNGLAASTQAPDIDDIRQQNLMAKMGIESPLPASTPTQNTQPNGLSGFGSTIGNIGLGLQGLSGLANAYLGFKALDQAKKQFSFQKGLANRNLANQAKVINNTYDNAGQVAAGMIGSVNSDGSFGTTPQAIVDQYASEAKKKHVDGSPIG